MGNRSVIFDANIWIASLYLKDDFHYEAKRIISRYVKRAFEICIPSIVLLEIINVLSGKGLHTNDIYSKLEDLHKNIKRVTFDDLDYLRMQSLCRQIGYC